MKERPILFNGEMVLGLLDDRKTNSRRPIKGIDPRHYRYDFEGGVLKESSQVAGCWHVNRKIKSPYGVKGDRLWVKETFGSKLRNDCMGGSGYFTVYRADNPDVMEYDYRPIHGKNGAFKKMKWTPSIHMPRWASRITLEITDVRVERVKDISANDALKEGCQATPALYAEYDGEVCPELPATVEFLNLWDSIYGKTEYALENNPYVWVYEFRRMEP